MRILFVLFGAIALHATTSNAKAVSPIANDVTSSINFFSTEFLQSVADEATGNLICSPFSASMALSMAALGARGNTEKQIRASLPLPSDETLAKNGFQNLVDSFKRFTGVELRLANKMFVANNFPVKADFKRATQTYFRSDSQSVDFTRNFEAAGIINDWVERQTNNRIKELVNSGDFGSTTAAVLVSAIYFKGDWASKFNARLTQLIPFHVDRTRTKEILAMFQIAKFRYGELPQVNARFIELPYKSENGYDAVSMIVILPNAIDGLPQLEKNLDKVSLTQLLNGNLQDVSLFLPKFKSESTIRLKGAFQRMGMTDMFENTANFTGIADASLLKVDEIVQKAFIEVNEEGSEASAATGIQYASYSVPRYASFHADHPFVYFIVKRSEFQDQGIPIFYGRITDFD